MFIIQLRESKALQKKESKFWGSVTLVRRRKRRGSPPPPLNQGCVSETLEVGVGYLGLSKGVDCKRLRNSHLRKQIITKFLLL